MATYTRNYPVSGSKLTIEYPDGLVKIVDASQYIQSSDAATQNEISQSLLIIPENGSFIIGDVEEINTSTLIYKDHQDEPRTTTISLIFKFLSISDDELLYVNSHFPYKPVEYINKNSPQIMSCMYSLAPLQWTDDNWDPTNTEVNIIYDVKLKINGIPNYFKSNVDFYYAHGESENDPNRQMYFSHRFSEPKLIGGAVVRDELNSILKIAYSNMLFDTNLDDSRIIDNLKWKVMSLISIRENDHKLWQPSDTKDQYLDENDCKVNGFMCWDYMDKTFQTYDIEKVDYKNKTVEFIFDELIAISRGYNQYGQIYELKQETTQQGELNVKIVDSPISNTTIDCVPTDKARQQIFSIPRVIDYIYTTRGGLESCPQINYTFSDDVGIKSAKNLYTYLELDPDKSYFPQKLISTKSKDKCHVPLFRYGLNIYPVYTKYQCAYFKLNCTSKVDYCGIYKDEDNPWHKKIIAALSNKYGEQGYLYRNESEWTEWTIDQKIQQIKQCMYPLKVVFINAPSLKDQEGKTKVVLSSKKIYMDVNYGTNENNYLTYEHIKQLLGEKGENEYYIIICNSNYAGGLFEKDVQTENYALVNVSDEFKANYMLQWADNANSQTYRNGNGNCAGDVVDFNELIGDNYKYNEYEFINENINEIRNANLNVLKQFCINNINFIKNNLLNLDDSLKAVWDTSIDSDPDVDQISDQIINATSNINNRNQSAKNNPFVYCYVLFHYMSNPWFKDVGSWQKDIPRNKFTIDSEINTTSLLAAYIDGFIRMQSFIKKHKCGFIKLNSKIIKYLRTLIHPRGSGSIFYGEYGVPLESIITPDQTNELKALIDFLWEFHKARATMYTYAHPLMSINGVYHPWSFLLEDTPGVKAGGTPEFLSSKIFEFPGFDANNTISDDAINDLIYQ